MKANMTPGPEDGPEREALRAFLRQWHVAGPPPDLEEDLRRTFRRRRRSGRRPVVWLALAAGLALIALSQVVPTRRPAPPAPLQRSAVIAPPPLAPPAPPSSDRGADRTTDLAAVPAPPSRVRRARVPSPTEFEVIVEPGQAELLAQFGRELRTVQQEARGTTPPRIETVPADAPEALIPQMQATDAPAYRATWETVAGEWPFMHRSVPDSGR
jgi:hypothetical protein